MFGAIEAGGTKFICGVGTGPGDLVTASFPTTSWPGETLASVIEFFKSRAGKELKAIGIGSFGPVDLDRSSPTYGFITSTPKAGWANFDLVGAVQKEFNVPISFDTDVNGALLGEARWGAAQGLTEAVYFTVGTGIGGGALSGGKLVHGLLHPEMGHLRIPHDLREDPFPGNCPFHGDCLEGLAAGPALQARWGIPAQELPVSFPGWALEARYLALAAMNVTVTLSPQRIIFGGGVMSQPQLFELLHKEFATLMNGYIRRPELLEGIADYIQPPLLGGRAGILGGLVLAEQANGSAQA